MLDWAVLFSTISVAMDTDTCQVLHSGLTSVHAAAREGRGQSSEQKTIKMFSNLLGREYRF